jgi:hypothetical protein
MVAAPRRLGDLGLLTGDTVNALDGDDITVDYVHHPVAANAEPVVSAPVERLRRVRVTGQCSHGHADGAHSVLIAQVTAG